MSNKDFNNLTSNITTVNGVQYRLRRVIDKTATNIHHIISRKEKQDFNVHDEHNKIRVNMIDHDNLNQFFKDKQNPNIPAIFSTFAVLKLLTSRFVIERQFVNI